MPRHAVFIRSNAAEDRSSAMAFFRDMMAAMARSILDVIQDRIDAGGWPTRDRAAPEEEC